jgi:phosphoglycerate-specific signal transduction histidine kinase
MEISGEVDIEISQFADFEIDLDVDRLAEELATDHNFVDDTILHAHVEEYCDSYVADRVSERVDEEIQELRDQVSELQPNNNYVRINDLHITIKEIVDARLIELFTRIIKEG